MIIIAVQDKQMLYMRYLDVCEKRDVVLANIIASEYKKRRKGQEQKPVCMLSIAAKLEAKVRNATKSEAAMHTVQSFRYFFPHFL